MNYRNHFTGAIFLLTAFLILNNFHKNNSELLAEYDVQNGSDGLCGDYAPLNNLCDDYVDFIPEDNDYCYNFVDTVCNRNNAIAAFQIVFGIMSSVWFLFSMLFGIKEFRDYVNSSETTLANLTSDSTTERNNFMNRLTNLYQQNQNWPEHINSFYQALNQFNLTTPLSDYINCLTNQIETIEKEMTKLLPTLKRFDKGDYEYYPSDERYQFVVALLEIINDPERYTDILIQGGLEILIKIIHDTLPDLDDIVLKPKLEKILVRQLEKISMQEFEKNYDGLSNLFSEEVASSPTTEKKREKVEKDFDIVLTMPSLNNRNILFSPKFKPFKTKTNVNSNEEDEELIGIKGKMEESPRPDRKC